MLQPVPSWSRIFLTAGTGTVRRENHAPSHDLVVQAALKAEHDKPPFPAFDDGLIGPPRLQRSATTSRRYAEAP